MIGRALSRERHGIPDFFQSARALRFGGSIMKQLLSGVAAAALISVAAAAWAQAPMSPSTAPSPPGASPAPADASPAPATAAPAAPSPAAPPPAAATTAPPPAAAAAPPAPAAEAARPRRPKRVSKPAVTATHRGVYSPRGMSDNIANQLNAQELNRVEGPPAMSPPGPGYAPPPPMAGGLIYGPPGYAPPPPWANRPPPYGAPPPWGYRPY
jgi:hypothetical protein